MTATTQDIKSDKLGTEEIPPPGLLGLPIETNTIIYGGTPVFSDANGYAVDGTPASGGLFCWGRCEKQVNNLNTNTPYGAAAAQNVTIRPGVYYFASDGSVTAAQVGKAVYALDNQTVTSSPVQLPTSTVWLPFLGIVQPPGVGEAGIFLASNTKVPVYLGYPTPGTSIILKAAIPLSLAYIQTLTSGTAFALGPVMPANAKLLDAEVINKVGFGTITTLTASLQGGSDSAGTILAAETVYSVGVINATPGTNPYQTRGGQQIYCTLTGGAALSTATLGSLLVNLYYTIEF